MSLKSVFLPVVFVTTVAAAMALSVSAWGQTIASKVDYIGTSRFLTVTGLKSKADPLLTLYIDVTNADNDDQQAYYRVAWLDGQGMPTWDDEAWKPILVHGGQIVKLKVIAPTVSSQDFKIEFAGEKNFSGTQGAR